MKTNLRGAAQWAVLDTVFGSLMSILTVLILSRVLIPDQLGVISFAQSVIAIVSLFTSLGLNDALVRRRPIDVEYDDSGFWAQLVIGIIAFILSVVAAIFMYMSGWDGVLCIVICTEATTLVFNALNGLPGVFLERKLRIAKAAQRTLVTRIVYVSTATVLAFLGYGIWSIVAAGILQNIAGTIVLWRAAPRFPKLRFSLHQARELARFGIPVMLEGALWAVHGRVFLFLVGVFHGLNVLGQLTMAMRSTDTLGSALLFITNRLGLPTFAKLQNDHDLLKQSYHRAVEGIMFITSPIFAGLMVTASSWIPLILGKQWIPAIPAAELMCGIWIITFSRALVGPYLKAIGKPQVMLIPSSAAAATTILSLLFVTGMPVFYVVLAWASRVVVTVPASIYVFRKYAGVSIADQFRPITGPLICTGFMIVCVLAVEHWLLSGSQWHLAVQLAVSVATGTVSYAALAGIIYRQRVGQVFEQLKLGFGARAGQ